MVGLKRAWTIIMFWSRNMKIEWRIHKYHGQTHGQTDRATSWAPVRAKKNRSGPTVHCRLWLVFLFKCHHISFEIGHEDPLFVCISRSGTVVDNLCSLSVLFLFFPSMHHWRICKFCGKTNVEYQCMQIFLTLFAQMLCISRHWHLFLLPMGPDNPHSVNISSGDFRKCKHYKLGLIRYFSDKVFYALGEAVCSWLFTGTLR